MKDSPHVRESRTVLDSGFQVLDSCLFLWNLDSGFQSFIVGFRIPCVVFRIPKANDSGFGKQNFPGFRNPDALTWGERIHVTYLLTFFFFAKHTKVCLVRTGPTLSSVIKALNTEKLMYVRT